MTDDELVGSAAVAAFHRVSKETARRWARSGLLAAVRPGDRGHLKYRWADVKAFRRPVATTEPGAIR